MSNVAFSENQPLVSVICTAFNHERYVLSALKSVVAQTYRHVELIVIDNASQDGTADCIATFAAVHPAVTFIQNPENVGLNRAFNAGLARARGEFIIDLSADDILLPKRIEQQVALFATLPAEVGVIFSNAEHIDAEGRVTGTHYVVNAQGRARQPVPQGSIFQDVLRSYFICTPTMMIRRSVLDALGGFDENLWFEDFDFWVRSTRDWRYVYQDEILTQKRRLPNSLSGQFTARQNLLLANLVVICQKALAGCQTPAERATLAGRLRQFIRKAFYAEQFDVATQFGDLLRSIEPPGPLTNVVLWLAQQRVRVNKVYQWKVKNIE